MANINDTASIFLRVNGEDAKKKFDEVKEKVADLKNQLKEASKAGDFRQVEELRKQLRPAVKEMDGMLLNIGRIDAAMKNLSLQTPKELRRTMQLINAEMNSGAIEVGSKEWKEYEEQLKKVKARYKELMDAQKEVKQSGMSFKDFLDIGGNLSMIFGSLIDVKDSVSGFIREQTSAYIELDAEMANVKKYTGMARQGVVELNEDFKKINTRTSIVELNKLAEEAGRLGKTSKEDVLGFVKAADIINVALDDLGEGATLEISKLTNIFGDEKALGTENSMLAVGSVINELSQNCTAAAPYLANFTKRLAGVGAQADMTIPQIMGFAAVLDSQGQAVEMSATAVSQLITKMFQDPAKIAKAVGMDVQEFTNMVKTDTNSALLTLLERLNAMGNMDVLAPIFKEMGTDGARASAVLASLAGNIDMVRQQQEVATQAYNEAISVVKEFNVQNETEAAKLEKARKKRQENQVLLGEKLLPLMRQCTSTGTLLIGALSTLIDFLGKYGWGIVTTTASIGTFIAIIKVKALWQEREIYLTKLQTFWNDKLKNGVSSLYKTIKSNPYAAMAAAAVAVAGALIKWSRSQSDLNNIIKATNKINLEAEKQYKSEVVQFEALRKAVNDSNIPIDARRTALEKLQEIVPDYHASLTNEGTLINNNTIALDNYVKSLKIAAEQQLASSKLADAITNKKVWWEDIGEGTQSRFIQAQINEQEIDWNTGNKKYENEEQAAAAAGMSPEVYRTLKSKIDSFDKKIDLYQSILDAKTKELSTIQSQIDSTKNGISGSAGEGGTTGDQSNAVKEWREKEEAINKMAYYTGQQTYEEYCTKKNEILIEYYDKLLADTSLKESERLKIEAERAEELHKQQTAADKATLDEKLKALEQQKKEEEDAIVNAYISRDKIEKADEQRLREQLFQINQDYLNKKKGLYVEYGKNEEAAKIEENLEKQSLDEKLRKHKEYIRLLDSMRRQYDKLSIEEREAAELLTIDALYQQKLISEEEYQQNKKAIEEKYKGEERKEAYEVSDGGGWGDKTKEMYFSISDLIDSVTEKGKLSFEDIGKAAESAWAVAGSALQIYSNYAQAEADLEVARIENKYDQQIKAAGKNDKKVKQLEEQRDREIAKAKSKANKKAMKIEIAQALAQTAMAAINAYTSASKEHWLLGPVAAAMATAAGMMQIATIRKQHQVQEAGYYSGGFTRKSLNNHEVVGVVHANEFVANASATANPALVPFFSLLDYAQRNNTIGSLTQEDVSHALGTGAVVQATKTTAQESRQNSGELLAVAGSLTGNNEVIKRLNEKLDEGIDAFVILDGERGFEQKYSQYLKMKNNSER